MVKAAYYCHHVVHFIVQPLLEYSYTILRRSFMSCGPEHDTDQSTEEGGLKRPNRS